MTVTRVLRGHDLVAEGTRERVLDAVRQTNYVPVRSAMQNRHVPTNILGIVPYHANVMRNRIDSETYEGICQAARKHGYDLLVMLRDESEWMAHRAEVRFLDRRTDGFLFVSTGRGEWRGVLEALVENEMPAVVCYRRDVPEGVAWIDPDNDAIIELAVGALVRAGHKRLVYLTAHGYDLADTGHLAHSTSEYGNFDDGMRRATFDRTVRDLNCTGRIVESDRPDWNLDRDILTAIRNFGATGIVCVNDHLALQLWTIAESAGVSVPEDLSITGVDDSPEARHQGLTSVSFGYDQVGAAAVDSWIRLHNGEDASDCCRVIPVSLSERRSVAPVRRVLASSNA